ncbi:MAG: tyrosine-type recombinase/integrase [Bacilli bacterium]|nr:tyrosine-type recombinase/integrase [Bacilli bacterium]
MGRRKKGEGFPRACRQRLARGDQRFYSIQTESGIKRVYLGLWKDKASEERYEIHKRYWERTGEYYQEKVLNPSYPYPDMTVRDLSSLYLDYLSSEKKKKKKTLEVYIYSLRSLCDIYGDCKLGNFNGQKLANFRQKLIDSGKYIRKTINKRIVIIRSAFNWGCFMEFVSSENLKTLENLPKIREGENGTKEGTRVRSVPRKNVEATLPFLPSVVADMVRLQLSTAARPEEIRIMRECDIDKSDPSLWIYRPSHDKTMGRRKEGKSRKIHLNRKDIEIVRRNFNPNKKGDYVFRPEEAAKEAQKIASERLKALYPNSVKSTKKKSETTKKYKPFYSNYCYVQAISRGCERAGVPHWNAYQVRHTRLTEIYHKYGIEAASEMAGHESITTTMIYLDLDYKKAEEVARKEGEIDE